MLDHIHYLSPRDFEEQFSNRNENCLYLMSRNAAKRQGLISLLEEKVAQGSFWVNSIASNPDQKSVFTALKAVGDFQVKEIVAVGGGSTIDLAKILKALLPFVNNLKKADDIIDIVSSKAYLDSDLMMNDCYLIAVPSTAGTGSEVTRWATLWDTVNKKKYSVDAPSLLPNEVWVVPELLTSMPKRLKLSTGLDAICQATEAFWAKKSDPQVQAIATKAIALFVKYFEDFLNGPENSQVKTEIATASLLAGIAFSKTRTTACHSISYPLTLNFGIEHGFAAALSLPAVVNINEKAVDCSALYEAIQPFENYRNLVDTFSAGIQPMRLSAFGISEQDLPIIAAESFTQGRMDNNPVDLTKNDVELILRDIY